MADLRTRYLGFELVHPLVPGASPLADDLDGVRRLEDAGAPLIALRSLIAAPVTAAEEVELLDRGEDVSPPRSLLAGLHEPPNFATRPDDYCEHVRRVRAAAAGNTPLVASLYAREMDDWLENARMIEQAGADALELNIYGMAMLPPENGTSVEEQVLEAAGAVCGRLRIPVAVKLLPCDKFDSFARRLADAGASALVMFNGFHRSDLGVGELSGPAPAAMASPFDVHFRYHWLARLAGSVGADLAFGGGARTAEHAVKAVLCGAAVVQFVSLLWQHGADRLQELREDFNDWLDEHEYASVSRLRGRLAIRNFESLESFDLAYNRQILMQPT